MFQNYLDCSQQAETLKKTDDPTDISWKVWKYSNCVIEQIVEGTGESAGVRIKSVEPVGEMDEQDFEWIGRKGWKID